MTFTEIERLIDRYDAATSALDTAVTTRISASMDASFRQMVRQLELQYPTWQSQGSLYASQRRLLLLNELGPLLAIVRPEEAAQYQELMQQALQLSHTTGATLADELVKVRDPGYPLQDFATIPIEAAVAQARDGVGRLYRYDQEFRSAAGSIVEQGLIQGWGTKRVQGVLEQELGVAKGKAETLARTEVMSALNTASQERYERNGLWVQVFNSPSERLCSFCLARHGNVYQVGQISVPFHPRCRDILAPWSPRWQELGLTDDAAIEASRAAIVAEFEGNGGRLDAGPTYWEKKAGLTAAPTPAWKPGDAPLPPVARAAVPPRRQPEPPPQAPALEVSKVVASAVRPLFPGQKIRGNEYRFAIKGGNVDGSDTTVLMSIIANGGSKAAYDVNFEVNDSFLTTGEVRREANTLIANQISRIFREDVASKKNGTRFETTAATGDERGAFREAMYAKMGFSFADGNTRPNPVRDYESEQYGVVKGGKLVPADIDHKPLGKEAQEEHRQAIRQALKDAIAKAREDG